jgi:hypothetical protein
LTQFLPFPVPVPIGLVVPAKFLPIGTMFQPSFFRIFSSEKLEREKSREKAIAIGLTPSPALPHPPRPRPCPCPLPHPHPCSRPPPRSCLWLPPPLLLPQLLLCCVYCCCLLLLPMQMLLLLRCCRRWQRRGSCNCGAPVTIILIIVPHQEGDSHQDHVFTGDVDESQCYGEVHTGDQWLQAKNTNCSNRDKVDNEMPIALIIFGDKSHTDLHGSLSVTPIIFTLSLFNRSARNNKDFWRPLAYIPNLSYGKNKADKRDTKGKIQDKHRCLAIQEQDEYQVPSTVHDKSQTVREGSRLPLT